MIWSELKKLFSVFKYSWLAWILLMICSVFYGAKHGLVLFVLGSMYEVSYFYNIYLIQLHIFHKNMKNHVSLVPPISLNNSAVLKFYYKNGLFIKYTTRTKLHEETIADSSVVSAVVTF